MQIKTKNYDILYSGSVIQIPNEEIIIKLPDVKEDPLTLTFNFIDDKNENEQTMRFILHGTHHLEIVFINFNNSLGTGNIDMIELGVLNDRKLFLNYRIYSIENIGKTVHYTFYLGEESKNV